MPKYNFSLAMRELEAISKGEIVVLASDAHDISIELSLSNTIKIDNEGVEFYQQLVKRIDPMERFNYKYKKQNKEAM